MKIDKVIEICKTLDRETRFECRVTSGKKAAHILFELQNHFLGRSMQVLEKKLGRFLQTVYCKYDNCNGAYYPSTNRFVFSRVHPLKTTKVISTIDKHANRMETAKQNKLVNTKTAENFDIEANILRKQVTYRGGGVEISLDDLGEAYEGEKMSAYQNYLGGGMLGRVCSNNTIERQGGDLARKNISEDMRNTLSDLEERLRKYFFDLTNPEDDEWESQTYEQNQQMTASAY